MATMASYLRKLIHHAEIAARNRSLHRMGRCSVCGYLGPFYAFDAHDPDEMLLCPWCRSISRHRRVATALLRRLGLTGASSVRAAGTELDRFDILDTAGKGPLSRFGGRTPHWVRGAYAPGSRLPAGLTHLDLQAVPFENESFDVVVSEDVLEHIPDPRRALAEIGRVLRCGGIHICTIPFCSDAPSRTRAVMRDGQPCHLLPAEHHWDPETKSPILVYTNLGNDLADWAAEAGMAMDIIPGPSAWEPCGVLGRRPLFIMKKCCSRPQTDDARRRAQ